MSDAPEIDDGILPYWKWQKASKFKRLTWSWQTCVYTLGITWYPQWDVRFDKSSDIAKPDIQLSRIEVGLYWWECSIWFARRITPKVT